MVCCIIGGIFFIFISAFIESVRRFVYKTLGVGQKDEGNSAANWCLFDINEK